MSSVEKRRPNHVFSNSSPSSCGIRHAARTDSFAACRAEGPHALSSDSVRDLGGQIAHVVAERTAVASLGPILTYEPGQLGPHSIDLRHESRSEDIGLELVQYMAIAVNHASVHVTAHKRRFA